MKTKLIITIEYGQWKLCKRNESITFAIQPFITKIGVLWEIYEYTFDGILGLNMQKFMLEDGTELVGRAALKDTMTDIIIDCCGSMIAAIIGYASFKRQKRNNMNQQTIVIEKTSEKMSF